MKRSVAILICYLSTVAGAEGQAVPSINNFSPGSGAAGSSVIISGSNFSPVPDENLVYFGPVRAIVSSSTESSFNVVVPSGATSQPISVTVHGFTDWSSSPFILTFPFTGNISGSFGNRIDIWSMHVVLARGQNNLRPPPKGVTHFRLTHARGHIRH